MPDPQGYLLPHERQILLRRYAPVLVLFPELKHQAPYPDDGDAIYTLRSSYHPRAVEFFLKHAKIRYSRRQALRTLKFPKPPYAYREVKARAEKSISAKDIRQLKKNVKQEHKKDPRYAGLKANELRTSIHQRAIQQRLAERIQGFDLPHSHKKNIEQWREYFTFLEEDEPEVRRSVVYGRLVQGRAPLDFDLTSTEFLLQQGPGYGPYDVSRTRIALQYWFQYYYDDWANRHEGDWEGITILMELSRDVITQQRELDEAELLSDVHMHEVGYAAHEDGYRRLWEGVQKNTDGRPLVYVARGSSASYFAWRLEGYPASARVGIIEKALTLPGKLLRGRRFLGRRWDNIQYTARFTGQDPKNTDWVAIDPQPHDRLDNNTMNLLERLAPSACSGVRRYPDFGPEAGHDATTYYLETDDLFWLEMVQEYGVQWGANSWLPGSKAPDGIDQAQRAKERREINQLAMLETTIERALDALGKIQFLATEAIPELNPALRPLRPRELRRAHRFPRRARPYIHAMWAWILDAHPEAWPGGPGLYLSIIFRHIRYPGILEFIRKKPQPEPLLIRHDPMYHLKTLLSQVRRARYNIQHKSSKWDNPFAWVRYICGPDLFHYGRAHERELSREELLRYLDCVDTKMSME